MDGSRRDVLHGEGKWAQCFCQRAANRALRRVIRGGGACRDSERDGFAAQLFALRAVCPAVGEDVVQPLFEQWRTVEPIHWKLQHELAMRIHPRLLGATSILPVAVVRVESKK